MSVEKQMKYVMYQDNEGFGIIQYIKPQGNGIFTATRLLVNKDKGDWKEPFLIKTFDGDELLEETEKPVWIVQHSGEIRTSNVTILENVLMSEMR